MDLKTKYPPGQRVRIRGTDVKCKVVKITNEKTGFMLVEYETPQHESIKETYKHYEELIRLKPKPKQSREVWVHADSFNALGNYKDGVMVFGEKSGYYHDKDYIKCRLTRLK